MKSNINLNEWVIKNPRFIDRYEPFHEESEIIFVLKELKGEERKEFIQLEEEQNPVHFNDLRERRPDLFE
ncbi:MAG: hypothetical protein FWH29_05080 [Methanobrevibacter sp.]|nr:hypothetical protein [Methanobrevibacter sp.]